MQIPEIESLRQEEWAWASDHFRQYCKYWTGTSLQLRLMRGVFPNANEAHLYSMIFHRRLSLRCKLVPVLHREYKYGTF